MSNIIILQYLNVFMVWLFTYMFVFTENVDGKNIVYIFGALAMGFLLYVLEDITYNNYQN